MSLLTSLNAHMSVNIITATSAVQNAAVINEELCLPPVSIVKSKAHTNLTVFSEFRRNELAILCCGNSELVGLYSTCYIPTLSSCSALEVNVRFKDRDSAVCLRCVCYNDQVPACVGDLQVATLVNDTAPAASLIVVPPKPKSSFQSATGANLNCSSACR